MHSKEYTALARAADERGREVVAFVELPFTGTETWIADRILTVAVMLEVPEYTAKDEPSFYVTKAFVRRVASLDTPSYDVNPDTLDVEWDTRETARLPRREALAEFTVRAIRAMNP